MRILVAVSSKHGSTREIADAVAEELTAAGHDAQVSDAADVDEVERGVPVVLGSAVYAGHWLVPARELLDRIDATARPVWVFSSGPIGGQPLPEEAEPAGIADTPGIRGHVVFGGRLDPHTLTFAERMVTKALRAPEGDYRDFDAIRAWARSIAEALAQA